MLVTRIQRALHKLWMKVLPKWRIRYKRTKKVASTTNSDAALMTYRRVTNLHNHSYDVTEEATSVPWHENGEQFLEGKWFYDETRLSASADYILHSQMLLTLQDAAPPLPNPILRRHHRCHSQDEVPKARLLLQWTGRPLQSQLHQ